MTDETAMETAAEAMAAAMDATTDASASAAPRSRVEILAGARAAKRAKKSGDDRLAARRAMALSAGLSAKDHAFPTELRTVRLGAAEQLGELVARAEPLRVALTPRARIDLFARAAVELASVSGWERVLLRDGGVDVPGGPATTALVRSLLGEVPRITTRLDAITRNANGKSRYSTVAGAVEELDGLTHATFLPLARRVAEAALDAARLRRGGAGSDSGGGRGAGSGSRGTMPVDHFSARRATLLMTTSDAHDGGQDGHYDKAEALCFHLGLTSIPKEEGTLLWLGSQSGVVRGPPVQRPLLAGTLRVTLGNLVHAGAEVDGPRGHVRVFAYVLCVTKGAPLHTIVAREVVDADGRPVPNFTAEPTLPDVVTRRATAPRRSVRGCNCCCA